MITPVIIVIVIVIFFHDKHYHHHHHEMVKVVSPLIPSLLTILALAKDVFAQNDTGNCILQLPKNPLTAEGLATPFILVNGNCNQTNPNHQVFVEATIFDPDTKTFGVYHPLVINEGNTFKTQCVSCESSMDVWERNTYSKKNMNPLIWIQIRLHFFRYAFLPLGSRLSGRSFFWEDMERGIIIYSVNLYFFTYITGTQPAIKPVVPTLPSNAVVGLWVRAKANSVTLTGSTQTCVDASCNAHAFFSAVQAADGGQGVVIPPVGNDKFRRRCTTTRSFGVIVQTAYLQTNGGQFAQATEANRNALKQFSEISSGSENVRKSAFIERVS